MRERGGECRRKGGVRTEVGAVEALRLAEEGVELGHLRERRLRPPLRVHDLLRLLAHGFDERGLVGQVEDRVVERLVQVTGRSKQAS